MTRKKLNPAIICPLAFLLIWIGTAIWMGNQFAEFTSRWSIEGSDIFPSTFVFLPYLMAGFGVIFVVFMIAKVFKQPMKEGTSHHITKIMEPSIENEDIMASGSGGSYTGYDIPAYCDNCGVKLDISEVVWIGPLTFKCPRCNHSHKAKQIRM
ncbi:MAG: hypothetical protein GF411_08340 [Candidatus Lokiarchaeota archaeon]|nr:hypothetical protein [Candidatus Lokiarchaeota archaeon]